MTIGLTGCSNWRQFIGIDQPAPDEFAVEQRAPLTIPPDFDLRPPQPGAPRPHEVTAAERAQQIIDAAGPGKPGDQASAALLPEQVGEQIDPNRALRPDSLASRLLGATDDSAGGTIVDRKTTTLSGVY
ncbi:MAG TPA: DUF3035 domain-containing protein [Stellaceae bacterium]|nr:DUF3035 domain-containing protein [Stellaceae bacterium]